MNKKSIFDGSVYYTLIVLLLLGLNVFLSMRYKNNINITKEIIDSKDLFIESQRISLTNHLQEQISCENTRFSPEITFKDINNHDVKLKDLLYSQPKLFIRFTGAGCNSCIENFDKELLKIKSLFSTIDCRNVVFLLSTRNSTELLAFKKSYDIKFDVYNIDIGDLPFKVEHEETIASLYYFLSDNTAVTKMFFIPLSGYADLSNHYFSLLRSKYLISQDL